MGIIAVDFGLFQIHWYGLVIAIAILAGMFVSGWLLHCRSQNAAPVIDMTLYGVPAGMLCARLYYVVLNWSYYAADPLEVFRFWHGGLDHYGAFLGFIFVLIIYCRVSKISFWALADCMAPGLAIGTAIGLWGSFFTQEGFGLPTNATWGIYIDFAYRPAGFEQFDFFHPIFLYESSIQLILFILLLSLSLFQIRKGFPAVGQIFLLFILLSAIAALCLDPYRIHTPLTHNITSGTLSISLIAVSLSIMITRFLRRRRSLAE